MIRSKAHHHHHHQEVGCFLLILVLVCSHHGFVGAEHQVHGPAGSGDHQSYNGYHSEDGDFVATVDRVVPSSPDPLHNK
ncbi:unnamed protein product [Linum trigynum]|uniref:Uncharacterized protein n=1 Tax=Linum trigynum TaxID=586398 RepID=A0AAV2F5H0_9ROSI